MKSKALVVLSTLVMALALMAQSTTQTTPAPGGDNAKTCACCNHGQADGKMACCGKDAAACAKDASCCKGGKLLPGQGWQGLPNDVEGPGRQDDLLCWRQVLHDVERQGRQELLWRQDVRTSASRSLNPGLAFLNAQPDDGLATTPRLRPGLLASTNAMRARLKGILSDGGGY